MFEWMAIEKTDFVNASGKTTAVKLWRAMKDEVTSHEVKSDGQDIDLIAWKELGSEMESYRLIQQNRVMLAEYGFRADKLSTLKIPV